MSVHLYYAIPDPRAPPRRPGTPFGEILSSILDCSVVGYVASGWLFQSRGWLLVYVVTAPIAVMMWLFNVDTPFSKAFRAVKVKASRTKVNFGVAVISFLIWVVAMTRLILA